MTLKTLNMIIKFLILLITIHFFLMTMAKPIIKIQHYGLQTTRKQQEKLTTRVDFF